MIFTRMSPHNGVIREMDLDVTEAQLDAWNAGELIQSCMPHLTAGEREFIMTGLNDEDWSEMFPAEDEFSGDRDDPVGPRDGYD